MVCWMGHMEGYTVCKDTGYVAVYDPCNQQFRQLHSADIPGLQLYVSAICIICKA